MKHSIVVVDDHLLIAEALKNIIAGFDDFEVSYICENGIDLQQKMNGKPLPKIILLDISMPEMDGFETVQWLKETHPNIQVMALSMQNDDQSLIKMIKNGAKGYMLKNTSPKALENGLRQLVSKGHFFPDWAASRVFASISDNEINAKSKLNLSDREIEFLKHSTSEMTYKEIAEVMFCSPRTIENYRDSLFEKLELKSRVGLAVFALKNGYAE
ncbi:response regulator transcription factor [Spongiivirga citrea]|uniref:Response regulator n=1 Tax=Spongiivirga citrea TaxID=1481457 RepID=A0A6M0CU85_9FLAO|nr:response regulator transcription factor [Spongiivirga citrea]NER19057.1 response regulator [Spongiivirga citrea]